MSKSIDLYNLKRKPSGEENNDLSVTVPGMSTSAEQLIDRFGRDFLDKVQGYYGGDEFNDIVIQLGKNPETLDDLDRQIILNQLYYKNQTLDQKLKDLEYAGQIEDADAVKPKPKAKAKETKEE